jgi:hypothetical protein
MPTAAIDALLKQVKVCDNLGSPFTANLCRLLATRLDHTTRFGRKILDWPGDPAVDVLPLRACGALHALARSWKEPELKAAYPPAAFDADHLWLVIRDVLTRHDNWLAAFLDSPPQTNEVGRSAVVLGAALHLAAMTRLPVELFEIGASGGLNLRFDRYRYQLGNGRAWGEADSPLVIPSEWRGALPPLGAKVSVLARAGCDRNPLDPASEDDAERLLAYVWPDQANRLARLQTALELAAADGIKVEPMDAADWVEQGLARPPRQGAVRLLFHTIVWQYMPPDTQDRIEAAIARAAETATAETPIARFGYEPGGKGDGAALTITLWPEGRTIPLGRADFHGRWVDWAAA